MTLFRYRKFDRYNEVNTRYDELLAEHKRKVERAAIIGFSAREQ